MLGGRKSSGTIIEIKIINEQRVKKSVKFFLQWVIFAG
jgi:hypothetical protein